MVTTYMGGRGSYRSWVTNIMGGRNIREGGGAVVNVNLLAGNKSHITQTPRGQPLPPPMSCCIVLLFPMFV